MAKVRSLALAALYASFNASAQELASDPGVYGPPLEIVHLYSDQFPTGFAMSSTGRMFSTYPGCIVPSNANNYTLAELTSKTTETPYPNMEINSPPMGRINQSTTPPSGVNYKDYLIAVQGIVMDAKDRLWLLDVGRVISPEGSLVAASIGGPKIVAIDTSNNQVFRTITFPSDVVFPDTYLNDFRVDLRPHLTESGQGVAYITDSTTTGNNGIITVDLGSGSSWRHLDGDPRVRGTQQHIRTVWNDPVYGAVAPNSYTYDSTGADGIALSADGSTLYWSVTASRLLFSIPTARLRDTSPASKVKAQASVQELGEKGVSDGIDTDSNDLVYVGSFENNALNIYNPENATVTTFVRDPRISWTDAIVAGPDNYLYFNENQIFRLPAVYPNGMDRTTRPLPLFRVPLVGNATRVALH